MSIVLAFLAGILVMGVGAAISGRFGSEERWRRELRKVGARRGWNWLLESCSIGEAMGRERLARKQVEVLGKAFQRLKTLSYHPGLAFGPSPRSIGEQFLRIDIEEEGGLLSPVVVISGGAGPWKVIPATEATPEAVLTAMGPPEMPSLGWVLAKASDAQLQALPGTLRTSLVHALLRDPELPGVVEGLVDRFQKAKAVAS